MQFLSLALLHTYTYEKEDLEASFEQEQHIAGPMTRNNYWNWLLLGRLVMLHTLFYSFASSSSWKLAGSRETERERCFSDSLTAHRSRSAGTSPLTQLSHLGLISAKPTEKFPTALDQLGAWPHHCKAAKPREFLWAPAAKSHSSWLPCWERQGDSSVPNTLLQTLWCRLRFILGEEKKHNWSSTSITDGHSYVPICENGL